MSTETALAEDLETVARIRAHLPCLERTAVAATPDVRGAVRAEIHMFQVALDLLDRTIPNGPGCGTHQDRTGTETDRG